MKYFRVSHGFILLVYLRAVSGVSYYCDYGWRLHGSRCYWRYEGEISGTDARWACSYYGSGSFLATVTDGSVQSFLANNVMGAGDAWIGGTDEVFEGIWMWFFGDDSFSYTNWNSGEPNNRGGNEACLQFYSDQGNTWNDLPCDNKLKGCICMKGAYTRPSLSSSCACSGSNCGIGSVVHQRKCTKTDILFLIDDSASVFIAGFTYAKSVASKLVDCLTIGQNETRISLMTFGSTVSTRFNFDAHFDQATVKAAIASTQFRGEGRTDIANALNKARILMGSNPTETLDIVIVLTDGKSNTAVSSASSEIHKANVYVFAMGIGYHVDSGNLQIIARNPIADYHAVSNNYYDLHTKVSKLISGLCIDYTLPEFLTCEMEIRDSSGEKAQSPTIGSSQCRNQQDYYGKYQPEHIYTHLMISAQYTNSTPSHPDFHFGVLTAGVDIVRRTKTGVDYSIQYSPVKVTSTYEPHITKDINVTISVALSDGER